MSAATCESGFFTVYLGMDRFHGRSISQAARQIFYHQMESGVDQVGAARARFFLQCFFTVAVVLFGLASITVQAREMQDRQEARSIGVSELPQEGRETLKLIRQGGPFPYARDGVVFRNYENRLPVRRRGYYREFTVKTPGMHNRGARRIVCGDITECYYTADHYQSFRLIIE